MIGEKAGEGAAISFLSPFLEAPRGLRRVSARRPTRELGRRAAHAVSMTPAYESSPRGAGLRSVARHQARRGNWRSHGDGSLRSEPLARRVTYAWSSSLASVCCSGVVALAQGRSGHCRLSAPLTSRAGVSLVVRGDERIVEAVAASPASRPARRVCQHRWRCGAVSVTAAWSCAPSSGRTTCSAWCLWSNGGRESRHILGCATTSPACGFGCTLEQKPAAPRTRCFQRGPGAGLQSSMQAAD
jgi:hypothetical protein